MPRFSKITVNSDDEKVNAVQPKQYLQTVKWMSVWVTILLIAGCGEEIVPGTTPSASKAPVTAEISVVEMVQQPQFYEAPGTVSARIAATVSAKVMGQIRHVLVQEGDTVAAGDILVVIDDSQLSARLQQAKAALAEAEQGVRTARAALASARASRELADKTLRRYETLLEKDSVSRQEFDEVKARYDQAAGGLSQAKAMQAAASSRVAQAKAGLSAAKTAFSDATVTAPYDATVSGKLMEAGDLAAPGIPLIRLETTGSSEVHIVLPESHIRQVNAGDKVSVVIPSLQGDPLTGEIKSVNASADPATRSFQVKVSLPDVPTIQAGMFARVMIPIGAAGMILVPDSAVTHHGQLSGVYLVDEKQAAHFRLIRPGRSFDGRMEVLSGLKPGDRYIKHPEPAIVDGIKVEGS